MNKRIFLKISFMGLVIWIFIAFYPFLCITQEDWNVFKSKPYKYTVRYPSSWYLLPSAEDSLLITSFPSDQYHHSGIIPEGGAEIFVAFEPSLKMSLSDFVKRRLKRSISLSIETTEVNGREAIKSISLYDRMTYRNYKKIEVCFSIDNRVYIFGLVFWENDPDESYFISTFDTIISSFLLED